MEGDGDPLEGLARIGRGEDQISEWLRDGVEWSLEEYPETTLAVLGVLETMGEGVDAAVTWVDDQTGNTMSGLWHELDPETRDQVMGGLTIVSVALSAGTVNALWKSPSLTYRLKTQSVERGPPRTRVGRSTEFTWEERRAQLFDLYEGRLDTVVIGDGSIVRIMHGREVRWSLLVYRTEM